MLSITLFGSDDELSSSKSQSKITISHFHLISAWLDGSESSHIFSYAFPATTMQYHKILLWELQLTPEKVLLLRLLRPRSGHETAPNDGSCSCYLYSSILRSVSPSTSRSGNHQIFLTKKSKYQERQSQNIDTDVNRSGKETR